MIDFMAYLWYTYAKEQTSSRSLFLTWAPAVAVVLALIGVFVGFLLVARRRRERMQRVAKMSRSSLNNLPS